MDRDDAGQGTAFVGVHPPETGTVTDRYAVIGNPLRLSPGGARSVGNRAMIEPLTIPSA
jgi:hypothetical protein